MRHNPLFDRFFGRDGLNIFGNPFTFEEYIKDTFNSFEDLVEEKIEFEKGNFKTIVTIKFDKQGIPVSHQLHTSKLESNNIEELKQKLKIAVEKEDFLEAAEIQKVIKSLEK